ncbi:MAG: hypothetical protein V4492_04255 [Chlamydiota bacterium]
MKILSLFLTVMLCPLLAEGPAIPESGSLSSSNASYDGNALTLSGHVVLDHGLGKMTAEQASLQRPETGTEFPFSFIQLRHDVQLALKSNAQILCDSADLDFVTLKGILLPAENGKVIYSDQLSKKKGAETVPLQFTGSCIELNFEKHAQENNKTEYDIQTILAKEGVVIDYAKEFQLQADRAFYRRELSSDSKTVQKEFQGIVTAYPKDDGSRCKLLHGEDIVDADMVDLNLIQSKLTLLKPVGTLGTLLLPKTQKTKIQFQSDHLFWDQIKNTLTLKGNIRVDEASIGTLTANDQLTIVQTTQKGASQLKSIQALGPASLLYKDSNQVSHKLISQGAILIDSEQLRATVESPIANGKVLPENQLYYEESEVAIYADNSQMEYALVGHAMQPTSLTLKGNIRLFSHDPKQPPRCGIADRVTYSLSTRTLILSADPGRKVLFWDETQGMHLSAPEVHITYDSETKQQNIKGVGKVQFAFTPEEQSKFQQIFPQLSQLP